MLVRDFFLVDWVLEFMFEFVLDFGLEFVVNLNRFVNFMTFVMNFNRLVNNFLVNMNWLVNFLLNHFFLFDDGGFVVNMHWLHESMCVFLLFYLYGNVNYDLSPATTADYNFIS